MKKKTLLFGLVLMGVLNVGMHPTALAAGAVNVGNKICPVSGEAIDSMGDAHRVEYEGKEYNLCCKMCAKDFNKEPAKYAAIADAEMTESTQKMPEAGTVHEMNADHEMSEHSESAEALVHEDHDHEGHNS